MTPDLQRIFQSKLSYRQRLAERPIAEKLRMLDAMREGALHHLGKGAYGEIAGCRACGKKR